MNRNLLILFILVVKILIFTMFSYSESLHDSKATPLNSMNFILSGDILYRSEPSGKTELFNKVAAVTSESDTFYYIRFAEGKWNAGFFNKDSLQGREFNIPGNYSRIYKFSCSNKVLYFLAEPVRDSAGDIQEGSPVFMRFNPDNLSFRSVEGVTDFFIIEGKSLVLKNNILDYNGLVIPLSQQGKLKISGIIDSRIAVISGVDGTEIVDLISGMSIYQYKDNTVPVYPGEYNLILEFGDNIVKNGMAADAENSIYYEIHIDGLDENRTETGRGDLRKIFHAKLATGRYHIIKPERWELDKIKGRYSRVNNVYQPAELKIYIPENRVLRIHVEFDGTAYKINQSVLFK